jgi:hypothetical protein
MLHPIEPVLEQELLAVVAFQRKVVEFVCRRDLAIRRTVKDKPRFERVQVDAHFGAQADWVWMHTSLCSLVSALNVAVRDDPDLRRRTVCAFDHDVAFDTHLDDAAFRFSVCALPQKVFKPLSKLLVQFYDIFGEETGFATEVTGTVPVSRDTLIQAFWTQNRRLKVCPACDGKKPDSIGGRVYGHCDHHFPKARYPTLSVHPLNLVPLCGECNATFKLERDAIDKACLAEMFLPFKRPVFGPARAVVSRSQSGLIGVSIEDQTGAPSARIEAVDHVYQLIERWNGRLQDRLKDSIVNKLRRQYGDTSRWGDGPTDMLANIAAQRDWFRDDRGHEPDAILSEAYCEFAAIDEAELATLRSQRY